MTELYALLEVCRSLGKLHESTVLVFHLGNDLSNHIYCSGNEECTSETDVSSCLLVILEAHDLLYWPLTQKKYHIDPCTGHVSGGFSLSTKSTTWSFWKWSTIVEPEWFLYLLSRWCLYCRVVIFNVHALLGVGFWYNSQIIIGNFGHSVGNRSLLLLHSIFFQC